MTAMPVDRAWVERNLGFDPIPKPAPASTFAFATAAPTATAEDFQREIIDFDSEAPEGLQFLAFTTATGLSRFTDIPWPRTWRRELASPRVLRTLRSQRQML
jgi:hypothetical protein